MGCVPHRLAIHKRQQHQQNPRKEGDAAGQQTALGLLPGPGVFAPGAGFSSLSCHCFPVPSSAKNLIGSFIVSRAGQNGKPAPAPGPRGKRKIRTSFSGKERFGFGCLVPVVGVEPTRVISTRDFESPSSAIPTHRLIVYVIIAYLEGQNQAESFSAAPARRAPDFPGLRGVIVCGPGPPGRRLPGPPDFPRRGRLGGRAGHGGTAFLFVVPAPFSLRPKAAFHFTSSPRAPRPRPGGLGRRPIYPVVSGRSGATFFQKDFTNEPQLYII